MQSKARTVDEYLASLPEDRREVVAAVRDAINRNLDPRYREGMQYGMIGWAVPHDVYPAGYHCDPRQPVPFAGLASQKNHVSLYLMCVYGVPEHEAWFRKAWTATGRKLDMGKACVRFKRLDDVALEVVGEAVRRVPVDVFLANYQRALERPAAGAKRGAKKKAAGTKAARTKAPARKSPPRKAK